MSKFEVTTYEACPRRRKRRASSIAITLTTTATQSWISATKKQTLQVYDILDEFHLIKRKMQKARIGIGLRKQVCMAMRDYLNVALQKDRTSFE